MENFDNFDLDLNLEETQETASDNDIIVNNAQAPANKVEFKFDFAKLNIPGVLVSDIGVEISRYPVDKIKFSKTKRELISIVTPQVMAIKTHYIDGVGSVLCSGKSCCKIAGAPRVKYLFPIVVYETDSKGKPVSNRLSYKVLAVSEGVYKDIVTLSDVQDLTTIDMLVTCKDETYQDISLTPAGNCRWQSQPKLVEQVVEFWGQHMEDIIKPIAREVEESVLLEQAGLDTGVQSNDVDFSSFI